MATKKLPPPTEHPPGAWLRLDEAAAYMRVTPTALRTAVHRKRIVPDGRGHKGTHMFRVATLDAYLTDGASGHVRSRCDGAAPVVERRSKAITSPVKTAVSRRSANKKERGDHAARASREILDLLAQWQKEATEAADS